MASLTRHDVVRKCLTLLRRKMKQPNYEIAYKNNTIEVDNLFLTLELYIDDEQNRDSPQDAA